jgi:putative DNA primase/helicase
LYRIQAFHPEVIGVIGNAIPDELLPLRQWVGYSKPTKVPLNGASTTDPSTWYSYDEALTVAQFLIKAGKGGVGFVFGVDDPYAGVDLDACVVDGQIHPAAQEIIDLLDSYWEVSPSGKGVHIIVRGELPDGFGSRTTGPWGGSLEVYDHARYFTMTGHGQGEIATRTDDLAALARKYLPPRVADQEIDWEAEPADALPDDELLAELREGDPRFAALYDGELIPADKEGDSGRDFQLCCRIAEVVGSNPRQIERLWAGSKLAERDKFERDDYRRRTIKKAIAAVDGAMFHVPNLGLERCHLASGAYPVDSVSGRAARRVIWR